MGKAFRAIIIGLSSVAVLILGFIAYFNYSVRTMHVTQMLAEDVEIASEVREITFEKPLKANKRIQEIALSIDGYKPDIDGTDLNIKLGDGTILRPEIELVDENNAAHRFKPSGRTFQGEKVLVRFRDETESSVKIAYKAVRIRSDKPFRCSVYWKDYDLK